MRISNLVSNAHAINHSIEAMVLPQLTQPETLFAEADLTHISLDIDAVLQKTQALCRKMNGKPEDLPTPSFRAYQWLKFMAEPKWLRMHAEALDGFYRQLPLLSPKLKLGTISHSLEIEIFHSAYLFRSKQKDRKVYLEINEGFIQAPAPGQTSHPGSRVEEAHIQALETRSNPTPRSPPTEKSHPRCKATMAATNSPGAGSTLI